MVREEETKRSRTKETCKPTHPRRKFNSLLADNNLYVYGEPRKAVGNGRE